MGKCGCKGMKTGLSLHPANQGHPRGLASSGTAQPSRRCRAESRCGFTHVLLSVTQGFAFIAFPHFIYVFISYFLRNKVKLMMSIANSCSGWNKQLKKIRSISKKRRRQLGGACQRQWAARGSHGGRWFSSEFAFVFVVFFFNFASTKSHIEFWEFSALYKIICHVENAFWKD